MKTLRIVVLIIISIFLIVLFPLAGAKLGQLINANSKIRPAGEWTMLLDSRHRVSGQSYSFGAEQVITANIEFDEGNETYEITEIYVRDNENSYFRCEIKSRICIPVEEAAIPFSPYIISLSHNLAASEIAPLPDLPNREVTDVLEIESPYNFEAVSYDYFMVLNDGTIWTFSYYDSGLGKVYGAFFLPIIGGTLGFIIAVPIIVIIFVVDRKIREAEVIP